MTTSADAHTAAALARLEALLQAQGQRLEQSIVTAGEARDGMIAIRATLIEQNTGARLQALEDAITNARAEARHDLVNAIDRMGQKLADSEVKLRAEIGRELDDHKERIEALEAEGNKARGSFNVIRWVVEPGLSALIAALTSMAAILGLHAHR